METRLDNTFIAAAFMLLSLVTITVNLLTVTVVLRTPQLRHGDQWLANLYILSLAVADTLSVMTCACYLRIACVVRSQQRRIRASGHVTAARTKEASELTSARTPANQVKASTKSTYFVSAAEVQPPLQAEERGHVTLGPDAELHRGDSPVPQSCVLMLSTDIEAGASLQTPSDPAVVSTPVVVLHPTVSSDAASASLKTQTKQRHNKSSLSSQNTRKTVSVHAFVAVNTLFCGSWIPFVIFSMFFDRGTDTDERVSGVLLLMIYFNSAVNFAIYGVNNPEYRNAFKKCFSDLSHFWCRRVIVASISAAASNCTLGTMALDRFCYIVYPFWYERFVSERTTKIYILVIWCASVVSACWASLTRNNFATTECKPVTVVMVYDTKIILTALLLFQSTMASVCYLRIACVVRTQQRRVRATVPTPANHSFRDNHVIQAESSISDKDEVVKPEASACKSSPKSLVPDAQVDLFSSKNVVLELQLADFQCQENNGDDLQAGETCSNSSQVALNSDSVLLPSDQVVAQTEKVAISLATDKTGELKGSSLDSMICSNAAGPQTEPAHPVNTGPSLVHHCIADRTVSRRIPEKDSNVQKPQSVAAARGEGNFKDLQQDHPLDNGKVFSTDCHRRCTVRTVTNPEPLLTSSMATILDKTLIAAVLLMIGLLVIAVNLLTIVVVLRTPQLRHSDQWQANMYVLSLAVADLLVGAALVWMACLFIPEARAIIDSSYVLCMSGVFVYTVFITVSHVTLLAIALDRLCYIVYPFFYGRFLFVALSSSCTAAL
ncbi:hypothetical protein C0Q70_10308 [Pomacea canaliculata]|uniref:G-protein coupled receptors family 1 profile domain-containing protein n=1 Tax=Pomacea canaliculata TaxID=400727 RepID=A0A2T7PC93_POMCA|nr:hypothetical protein C0Q70_10308 [Pomacea canaliculata]